LTAVSSTATRGSELFTAIVNGRQSFWSAVYEPFMARDLTRHDVREVVRLGLKHTLGNYKLLVRSFNMAPDDYKRFLNFLRKYECHVPFQIFRQAPSIAGKYGDGASQPLEAPSAEAEPAAVSA
jgi:hypothetical protein